MDILGDAERAEKYDPRGAGKYERTEGRKDMRADNFGHLQTKTGQVTLTSTALLLASGAWSKTASTQRPSSIMTINESARIRNSPVLLRVALCLD